MTVTLSPLPSHSKVPAIDFHPTLKDSGKSNFNTNSYAAIILLRYKRSLRIHTIRSLPTILLDSLAHVKEYERRFPVFPRDGTETNFLDALVP